MGEWHQRPRYRELPKGRTTFGSGCLGYFCHAELSEGLRKSQDRRGAGHAPAISYESAWEADRAYLGIYSRGSVWASGSARNEPCLPGVLEEANQRIVEFRLRATMPASSAMTTYSTFGSSSCGFAGGSSIESCAPGERGFGIRFGVMTMTSAPTTPVSYPFQLEESRPPHQWNYPMYEGKGEDMRRWVSKGKGRLPAYEREYPLPKLPSVPPLPQLGVNLPMPPPPPEEYAAVPTTPPTPRPTGVESPPPPPSPDAMSEASDSAVLERGF